MEAILREGMRSCDVQKLQEEAADEDALEVGQRARMPRTKRRATGTCRALPSRRAWSAHAHLDRQETAGAACILAAGRRAVPTGRFQPNCASRERASRSGGPGRGDAQRASVTSSMRGFLPSPKEHAQEQRLRQAWKGAHSEFRRS
eukprot:10834550-Heterocapsa_arctica.AAC.1